MMYRNIQHNSKEDMMSLYVHKEESLYRLYLERERNGSTTITVFDENRVLKELLRERGTEKSGTTKSTRKC
jgi:hypothetical protein